MVRSSSSSSSSSSSKKTTKNVDKFSSKYVGSILTDIIDKKKDTIKKNPKTVSIYLYSHIQRLIINTHLDSEMVI